MGLRGVKKNHPLGFIWHPLEGVGIFTIDFLAIHVGKSTVRPMDPVWKISGDYAIAIFMFLFVVSGVTVVYLVLFKEQQVGVDFGTWSNIYPSEN